jgi:hypothetical protein
MRWVPTFRGLDADCPILESFYLTRVFLSATAIFRIATWYLKALRVFPINLDLLQAYGPTSAYGSSWVADSHDGMHHKVVYLVVMHKLRQERHFSSLSSKECRGSSRARPPRRRQCQSWWLDRSARGCGQPCWRSPERGQRFG